MQPHFGERLCEALDVSSIVPGRHVGNRPFTMRMVSRRRAGGKARLDAPRCCRRAKLSVRLSGF